MVLPSPRAWSTSTGRWPSAAPGSAGDKARITYRELLQMRSGIDFDEAYEFAPLFSSVLAMLYTRGRADMAAFAAAQPMAAEAGTVWRYKSGDSLILAAALRDLVGADRYPDYPWTALFDRIGVTSAVWERDAAGTFVGSSYLYLTPRDLARIGLLYLRDGCWAGTRILPEGWVAFAGHAEPGARRPRHLRRPLVAEPPGPRRRPCLRHGTRGPARRHGPLGPEAARPAEPRPGDRAGRRRPKRLRNRAVPAGGRRRLRPMKRWAGRIALGLLVLLAAFLAFNWTHLAAFPGILPAFTAKEYCSCRFVMGQSDKYCRGYVKQWLPISELTVDEAARLVTARGTGAVRSARWRSPREGCRLD